MRPGARSRTGQGSGVGLTHPYGLLRDQELGCERGFG